MVDIQSYAVQLLQTPAFYIALLGLKNAVVHTFLPTLSPDISSAFDNLVLVVASVITGKVISDARALAKAKEDARMAAIAGPMAETRART